MRKRAKAQVDPLRQRTQYTCVATSVLMALKALGKDLDEDKVNRVLGAEPKKGARWEEAIATIQYFGCRGTLTAPSTLDQIKGWTDQGLPVLIAWNPEDRPWSHASCVFHVEEGRPESIPSEAVVQGSGEGLYVWVADPNIPNPSKTYRIVHEDTFYSKWGEDWTDFIVRRPALVVSLEVDSEGRQVMASRYGFYVVDKKKGVVLQGAPDGPAAEEDLWLWIDEVSGESRKTLTVMTTKEVVDKWGKIKWAPKRRQVMASTKAPMDYTHELKAAKTAALDPKTLKAGDEIRDLTGKYGRKGRTGKVIEVKKHGNDPFVLVQWKGKRNIDGIVMEQGGRPVDFLEKVAGRKGRRPQQNVPKKDKNGPMRIKIDPTKSPGKNPFSDTDKHRRNDGPHRSDKYYRRRQKHEKPYDREAESDSSTLANAELQSSFYKTLEGEPLQVSPLRTMPDYGERDFNEDRQMMDINDMLAELKDNKPKTKKKANARPAGGLYGYTKGTQRDVMASVRKVQKSASKLARAIYAKDERTFNFLHTHAERSNSLSARILCAAMESIGPKLASTKTAGHGMYGYRLKTARLALEACVNLSQEAGSVAYDLHKRRTAKYTKITSFLKDHSKRGRCRYARILLRFYPDAPIVTASDDDADEKEAKHEKGKSVPLKDLPKKLQENAKDESKHIKPKKKASADDLDGLFAAPMPHLPLSEEVVALMKITAGLILKDADGCSKLPPALKKNCENPSFGKKDDSKDDDSDEDDKKDDKKDDGKMPADLLEKFKKKKKADGCDKLPPALKKNCEAGPPGAKKDDDSDDSDEDKEKKEASGCDKLPPALKKNCEAGPPGAKKDDDDSDDDSDDGDKKASRTRLTTRISNGTVQRGRIMFGADKDDEKEGEDDEKEGDNLGRSQLPGETESNESQPKIKGKSGYNPGSTEMNGQTGAPKAAAESSELAEKAEGHTVLPNDEESDKVQPDMGDHGWETGHAVKVGSEYITYTTTTPLPDGSTLIWME